LKNSYLPWKTAIYLKKTAIYLKKQLSTHKKCLLPGGLLVDCLCEDNLAYSRYQFTDKPTKFSTSLAVLRTVRGQGQGQLVAWPGPLSLTWPHCIIKRQWSTSGPSWATCRTHRGLKGWGVGFSLSLLCIESKERLDPTPTSPCGSTHCVASSWPTSFWVLDPAVLEFLTQQFWTSWPSSSGLLDPAVLDFLTQPPAEQTWGVDQTPEHEVPNRPLQEFVCSQYYH
jgi:hypothetical protein